MPPRLLRKVLDARDAADLWVAERQGLIPDPWLQTSEICSLIANVNRSSDTKAFKPEDFLYRVQKKTPQSLDELMHGFHSRRNV